MKHPSSETSAAASVIESLLRLKLDHLNAQWSEKGTQLLGLLSKEAAVCIGVGLDMRS